ncbi:MAG: hypothetical protein K2O70_10985 [Desulfovibrionaceae bacterium]|nr:hypothetical protein [Desulfovibrionaceae bacterium]
MQQSVLPRLARLACGIAAIWLFFWVITPIIVRHCPPLAHYGAVAQENDIQPGAMYYNDVPVTVEAERNNRDTVRFLPGRGTRQP